MGSGTSRPEPSISSAAPLATVVPPAVVPRALLDWTRSTPTLTAVTPVYVLGPDRTSVPDPSFVTPPVVPMAPPIVVLPAPPTVSRNAAPLTSPDTVSAAPASLLIRDGRGQRDVARPRIRIGEIAHRAAGRDSGSTQARDGLCNDETRTVDLDGRPGGDGGAAGGRAQGRVRLNAQDAASGDRGQTRVGVGPRDDHGAGAGLGERHGAGSVLHDARVRRSGVESAGGERSRRGPTVRDRAGSREGTDRVAEAAQVQRPGDPDRDGAAGGDGVGDPDLERAGADGGGARVRVDERQEQRAGRGLGQATGSGDRRSGLRDVAGTVDGQEEPAGRDRRRDGQGAAGGGDGGGRRQRDGTGPRVVVGEVRGVHPSKTVPTRSA